MNDSIIFYFFNGSLEAKFEWLTFEQSPSNNSSKIAYSVKFKNNTTQSMGFSEIYCAINNETVAEDFDEQYELLSIGPGLSTTWKTGTFTIKHNEDGTKIAPVFLYVDGLCRGEELTDWDLQDIEILPIERMAVIITATNFTDEENPVITYENPAGNAATKLEACISFTGAKDDIPYREISKTGTKYTFVLTEDERNTLRLATLNSPTKSVRFYLKTTIAGETYFSHATRTFTVVNSNPVLNNPIVKDILPETLALTGDENIIVKNESMVEYSFEPVAFKGATIVAQSVQCGNKKITGMSQGVIDDAESGTVIFSATDSRGFTTTIPIEKTVVNYIKPTCYQDVEIGISGETGAKVNLTIRGNYFNGSFGVVSNVLKVEVRHTQNDGTMGDWVDLTPLIAEATGNTYKLQTTISGLSYNQSYVFQSRVTDKLNFVQSAQYTAKLLPIFDWSNDDFNFNVPVNINGETVLRHNKEANNTVLSASGGHIYLRPGGTDDTNGEIQITPQGNVYFNGSVYVNGNPIPGLSTFGDYIVEAGTEAMGSNGTWHWEKWASGKAVCWGCRNYGRMSTSTALNGEYISSYVSQDFPTGLFKDRPDFCETNFTCDGDWDDRDLRVAKGSVFASRISYLWVIAKTSRTLASSYISIHAIGRWTRELYDSVYYLDSDPNYHHINETDACPVLSNTSWSTMTNATEAEAIAAGKTECSICAGKA